MHVSFRELGFLLLIGLSSQGGGECGTSSYIWVAQIRPCRSIGNVYYFPESGKAGSSSTYVILCLSPFHTSCSYCFLFSTAHSGGHDVWNVVFDMVKNVSEVMMSTLPNFWKIAKGFLDGKYRKVRFHCCPKVWSTDTRPWRHRTHPRSFHDEVHLKFGLWLTRLSSFTYLSSLNSSSFRIWQ
jgi:hypothetical protein